MPATSVEKEAKSISEPSRVSGNSRAKGSTHVSYPSKNEKAELSIGDVRELKELPGFEIECIDKFKSEFTETNNFRFRLKYKGILIYGSSVIVEWDDDEPFTDSSYVVQDDLIKQEFPPDEPKIKPQELYEWIEKFNWRTGVKSSINNYDLNPSLYYFYDRRENEQGQDIGQWRLVYITSMTIAKNSKPKFFKENGKLDRRVTEKSEKSLSEFLPESFDYVIDAHTGDIIVKFSPIRTFRANK